MFVWVFFAVERSSAEMQWLLSMVQTDTSHYVRLVDGSRASTSVLKETPAASIWALSIS